jgi:hypothetical protein
VTNADGSYSFAGLPADGAYSISASNGENTFLPGARTIDPLTSDTTDVDFVIGAPTVSLVSISGRVLSTDGRGITNVNVSATGPAGEVFQTRTVRTGFFRLDGLEPGKAYLIEGHARRFVISPQSLTPMENITDVMLVGQPLQ